MEVVSVLPIPYSFELQTSSILSSKTLDFFSTPGRNMPIGSNTVTCIPIKSSICIYTYIYFILSRIVASSSLTSHWHKFIRIMKVESFNFVSPKRDKTVIYHALVSNSVSFIPLPLDRPSSHSHSASFHENQNTW